ncbi:MAG: diacylglycerol kinase family protein [Clostridia bacterium]|nr:diacylglycerol kinase family protein [Clostridia bacterium]
MKRYVLYNPYAGNGGTEGVAQSLAERFSEEEIILKSVLEIADYSEFLQGLEGGDKVTLCGGDGTLNRFANACKGLPLDKEISYYPTGSGNDFAKDIAKEGEMPPYVINGYLQNLPTVTVNGKDYAFINGVGFGIDGYCCEVGDKLKEKGKKANYTAIAVKGLLFHYKTCGATVTVDGEQRSFKNVWLAPTMFGTYYGGGMMPAPNQKRDGEEKQLSVLLFTGKSKLKTLMIFPSIFKGEHVKKEKYTTVLSGKEITVRFDEPRALQIDGETILGVTEYTAKV